MTTQFIIDKIQFKRGTTAQRIALVLDAGEPFFDETEGAAYVGDGVTLGGVPSAGAGGGISQAAADSRYIQQSQINAANGVAGLDTGSTIRQDAIPMPAIPFTALVANKLA